MFNPMHTAGVEMPRSLARHQSFRVSRGPVYSVPLDGYDQTVPPYWKRLSVGAGHAADLYKREDPHTRQEWVAKRVEAEHPEEYRFYRHVFHRCQELEHNDARHVLLAKRRLDLKLAAIRHVMPQWHGVAEIIQNAGQPLERHVPSAECGVSLPMLPQPQHAEHFLLLENIRAHFDPNTFAGIDLKMGRSTAETKELLLRPDTTLKQRMRKSLMHFCLDRMLSASHKYGFRTEGLDGRARPMGYHKGMKKQFRKEERRNPSVNIERLFQQIKTPALKRQLLGNLLTQLEYVGSAIQALGPCVFIGSSLYIALGRSNTTQEWTVCCKMIDFAHSHHLPGKEQDTWVIKQQDSYRWGLTHLQEQVRKLLKLSSQN